MAILGYSSHNVTIIFNTKCAQTTLYEIFGRPWQPKEPAWFHGYQSHGDSAKLGQFKQTYQNNYVICFVRNSYSRMISMWSYSKQHDKSGKFPNWPKYCEMCYEDWRKDVKPRYSRLIPLSYFIDTGLDSIDYIGHQETLDQDLKFLAKKFNIPFVPASQRNHSRFSPVVDWKSMYTDRLKHIVSEMYKEDIKMFNFKI